MTILNVFEPGLKRGSARLAYMPEKRYFYVQKGSDEDVKNGDGWRVYMRAAVFLYEKGVPLDKQRFLVVKKKDKSAKAKAWEPIKGQMEGRDGSPKGKTLVKLMANNVRREVEEEGKIEHITGIRYTGLVYQGQEDDYPKNHYFQYHIFTAEISSAQLQKAADTLAWYREHPDAFNKLEGVKREKDELAWFDPKATKLMGRWAAGIVALYLANTK
jgi:8-oxo-dGTP pyrophosphatase MutT (NUDIX family)